MNVAISTSVVEATKAVQKLFGNKVERLSFDRGFHSPENQKELSKIIPHLCLPKPEAKQSVVQLANADDEFLQAQQNHPGVESAVGALPSGNGMEHCRDRSELGFERYVSLAILGRNMHTSGRRLIAKESGRQRGGIDSPQSRLRRQRTIKDRDNLSMAERKVRAKFAKIALNRVPSSCNRNQERVNIAPTLQS